MESIKKTDANGNTFEFNIDPVSMAIVERQFSGHTKRDLEIRNQPLPRRPFWLNITIRLIRFYQKRLAHKLGNRCVFDPSCSHYAELAFRKKGFINGMKLTMKRLRRCRPGNGGADELN